MSIIINFNIYESDSMFHQYITNKIYDFIIRINSYFNNNYFTLDFVMWR